MSQSIPIRPDFLLTDAEGGPVAAVEAKRAPWTADANQLRWVAPLTVGAVVSMAVTPREILVAHFDQRFEWNDAGPLLGPLLREMDMDPDEVYPTSWSMLVEQFLHDLTNDRIDGEAGPLFDGVRTTVRGGGVVREPPLLVRPPPGGAGDDGASRAAA